MLTPGTTLNEKYIIGTKTLRSGRYQIYDADGARDGAFKEAAVWELLPASPEKRTEDGSVSFSDDTEERRFQCACEELMCRCRKAHKAENGMLLPLDSFKENGTVYTVTEAITGDTLLDYCDGIGGGLSKREAFAIMLPILKSVYLLNKHKIRHGGVWLNRMYFTQGGKIKLGLFNDTGTPDEDDTSDIKNAGMALFALLTGDMDIYQNIKGKSKRLTEDELTGFRLNKNEAALISALIYAKSGRAEAAALKGLIAGMEKAQRESQYANTIGIINRPKAPLIWVGAALIAVGLSIIGGLFAFEKVGLSQAKANEAGIAEVTEPPEELAEEKETTEPPKEPAEEKETTELPKPAVEKDVTEPAREPSEKAEKLESPEEKINSEF